MPRILLIQTASPKRILEKAEQILAAGFPQRPELFILCDEEDKDLFQQPGITVYPLSAPSGYRSVKDLAQNRFDAIFAFWTGEKRYRRWKALAFTLKANHRYILSGDGNEFRLTWKAFCRHALFRFQHPLPSDHRDYAKPRGVRERILVVQSAEPSYVLTALEMLRKEPLFINPRYTMFCRNKPEIVNSFQGHTMLDEVLTHVEARNSLRHLRELRRRRFDAIVLFFTGDPSYWKVKPYAFLLGTRRILIFNESCDCFFFNFHQWLALVSHRVKMQSYPRRSSRGGDLKRILISLVLNSVLKSALLPFRFLWLLLVWLRLRYAGLKSSREGHGYS